MPKFRNISPLGALDIPLLGCVIAHGAVVEVTPEQATYLAGQQGTWQPLGDPVVEQIQQSGDHGEGEQA